MKMESTNIILNFCPVLNQKFSNKLIAQHTKQFPYYKKNFERLI